MVCVIPSASRTITPAPQARNCSAASAKWSMCGPKTTALPQAAGSSGLCPPTLTRLPPTKTSVAPTRHKRLLAPRQSEILPGDQPCSRRPRCGDLIVLEIAGPHDPLRLHAELDHPLHIAVGLHGAEGKRCQRATEKRPDPAIPGKGVG